MIRRECDLIASGEASLRWSTRRLFVLVVGVGYDSGMHSHLATVLQHLASATSELRAAVDALPAPLRGEQPAPERWSANEVIEHVGKVETLFIGSLLARLETARGEGLGAEVAEPPMLPEQTRAVVTDRSSKRTAPDAVQPTGTVDAMAGLDRIEAGHARLRDAVTQCQGQALSSVTTDHRFFGTLNVYQWMELFAGHERRHAAQVRELTAQLQERHVKS